jgi:Spy/CpxP family protein refolding chaperone
MLNKIFNTLFLLVFISSPATVLAKDYPPGKWWHNHQVSKKLNLSDEEIKMLDKQFVDSRRKLIKLKSVVESEQFELDFLFDRESINKEDIMEQFDKFQKAKKNLAVERFRLIFEVRKILGLERFRQLKEFKKLQRQKMRQELKSLKNHLKERPGAKG